MPFDLSIHRFRGLAWSIGAPRWLDATDPPFGKEYVRQIIALNYTRTRYAVISAEELGEWNENTRPAAGEVVDEVNAQRSRDLDEELASAKPDEIYVLQWNEWEFGHN